MVVEWGFHAVWDDLVWRGFRSLKASPMEGGTGVFSLSVWKQHVPVTSPYQYCYNVASMVSIKDWKMTLLQIKESSKLTNPQTKGNQWQNSKQNSALQSETPLHCLQATLPPANSTTVCALSGSNLMLLEELVSLKTEHKKYTCIFLVCEGILFLFFCCWWILFVLLSSTPLKSPFVKKSSINSSCINML